MRVGLGRRAAERKALSSAAREPDQRPIWHTAACPPTGPDQDAAGAAKVYSETASGAKTDRAVLAKVLKRLDAGDVLVATRLDRLARSTRDLLNTLHAIAEHGAGFKSLADTWADTTTPHADSCSRCSAAWPNSSAI
jgi:DNA invertase Pin-like site-specific DNA recombinase